MGESMLPLFDDPIAELAPITYAQARVPVALLVVDEAIYPREEVNSKRVEHFAGLLRDGVRFEPIEVEALEDGTYRVLDGAHRRGAYREIGEDEADVLVVDLRGRDPLLYAASKAIGPRELREKEAREVARRAYTNNPKLTSAEIGRQIGRSRQTVDEYIADLRGALEYALDLKIMRLDLLGLPLERAATRLGFEDHKGVVKHLGRMPEIASVPNAELSRGLPQADVAKKHGWPEPLVWAVDLKDKTDAERLDALKWGLRTWDVWGFGDVDKRFGDDWPGRIPAQLVALTLYYFTKQGDLVFDPMAGGGVVADTCLALNRRCWSFDLVDRPDVRPEIEPHRWVPGALEWPVNGKSRPDLIFFDPPYFTKKADEYEEGSISGLARDDYLTFFGDFFRLAITHTKKSTRIAFLNADWRDFEGKAATDEDPAAAITVVDYASLLERSGWEITHIIDCPLSSERFTGNMVTAMQGRRTLGVVRRTLLMGGGGDEVTGVYTIKPDEIEYLLERCPFKYPRRGEDDPLRGFGHVAVIPKLYEWLTTNRRFPRPDEGMDHVMSLCDPRYQREPMVRRRGEKLYLDFGREMHTYALLANCDFFGQVLYQKALDVNWDVDYLAQFAARYRAFWGCPDEVAIQSMMRASWRDCDPFVELKEARRRKRASHTWANKVYALTNRSRRYWKSVAGLWLFGPAHIQDLTDELRGDFAPKPRPTDQQLALPLGTDGPEPPVAAAQPAPPVQWSQRPEPARAAAHTQRTDPRPADRPLIPEPLPTVCAACGDPLPARPMQTMPVRGANAWVCKACFRAYFGLREERA